MQARYRSPKTAIEGADGVGQTRKATKRCAYRERAVHSGAAGPAEQERKNDEHDWPIRFVEHRIADRWIVRPILIMADGGRDGGGPVVREGGSCYG